MNPASRISTLVSEMGGGPVLVHSDPFRAARLVGALREKEAFLDAHVSMLRDAAADHVLWLPAFNYDFPKTQVFDVRSSESQLGPIPERFRLTKAEWRTPIPIFSIAGTGPAPLPSWGPDTDPFGEDSIFAALVKGDGVVLYYGYTFAYNTLVHYAERVSGGPVYRYDKLFSGRVVMANGASIDGSLDYHVRPLGTGLDYDWERLMNEAIDAGVCRKVEGFPEILAASARSLSDLWVEDIRRDPFALLDSRTRAWAEPAVEKLGRRFVVGDFEPQHAGTTA
ncbi:MAG: AAC(3) family N-acetyltransferase [Gemmatimonadales bacterium]